MHFWEGFSFFAARWGVEILPGCIIFIIFSCEEKVNTPTHLNPVAVMPHLARSRLVSTGADITAVVKAMAPSSFTSAFPGIK